jgi:hypothetical protein
MWRFMGDWHIFVIDLQRRLAKWNGMVKKYVKASVARQTKQ